MPAFHFDIDPKTPIKDLLPAAPQVQKVDGPILSGDLAKVPEIQFQDFQKAARAENATREVAHQLAKIGHANKTNPDAFVIALKGHRPDLAGLPLLMGDACKQTKAGAERFAQAVSLVNSIRQVDLGNMDRKGGRPVPSKPADFWPAFQEAGSRPENQPESPDTIARRAEEVIPARSAALMQVLAAESAEMRLGLVKYLSEIPVAESTHALARLAIFSQEESVRLAAIKGLKSRDAKNFKAILLSGLRYPWPDVAKNSAEAIARLNLGSTVPDLITVLETEDARMPAVKTVDGKPTYSVREVVKLNHLQNCMLCHTAGQSSVAAQVPVPGQPVQPSFQGYGQSRNPSLMVRVDVTYLRQDFSLMMPVKDHGTWPTVQRFDFLVRERTLTKDEAGTYREKLSLKDEGVYSPYHKAALFALRELTGKDTAPTAEAWRKLLKLSAK
jgi:hypothetical protein